MDVNISAGTVNLNKDIVVKNLIKAEYKDTCNYCFQEISAGDQVAWYGKGFGVRHYKCYLKRDSLLTQEEYDVITDW